MKTGRTVLEVISRANRDLGTTTAVITHNADIAQMANRVVHLSGGLITHIEENPNPIPASELEW